MANMAFNAPNNVSGKWEWKTYCLEFFFTVASISAEHGLRQQVPFQTSSECTWNLGSLHRAILRYSSPWADPPGSYGTTFPIDCPYTARFIERGWLWVCINKDVSGIKYVPQWSHRHVFVFVCCWPQRFKAFACMFRLILSCYCFTHTDTEAY
jgi:hypothetical protein